MVMCDRHAVATERWMLIVITNVACCINRYISQVMITQDMILTCAFVSEDCVTIVLEPADQTVCVIDYRTQKQCYDHSAGATSFLNNWILYDVA